MGAKFVLAERVAEAQHVAANGARWASNMIAEINSSHGRYLSVEQRDALKAASAAFLAFQMAKIPDGFTPTDGES